LFFAGAFMALSADPTIGGRAIQGSTKRLNILHYLELSQKDTPISPPAIFLQEIVKALHVF
jgi:hypothetical protein